MERRKAPASRWPMILAFVGLGIVVLALIVVGVRSLMSEKSGKPRRPPTVSLMPDKPPPPPPPPKEEKRPEPKDEAKEVKVTQNVEQAPQPAPSERLNMDEPAGDGDSPFSSGKVNQDYIGGDVNTVSAGGGGMGAYAGRLQRHFQDYLARNRKLRGSDYRVVVKLWLRRDGSLERVDLADSTGTESLDELLRETLLQAPPLREAPPESTVQPIRIRITNRGAA